MFQVVHSCIRFLAYLFPKELRAAYMNLLAPILIPISTDNSVAASTLSTYLPSIKIVSSCLPTSFFLNPICTHMDKHIFFVDPDQLWARLSLYAFPVNVPRFLNSYSLFSTLLYCLSGIVSIQLAPGNILTKVMELRLGGMAMKFKKILA